MTEIKKVTLSENELDQISGGISTQKALLIGGLALLGIGAATFTVYAYKKGLLGGNTKTHPNANHLELGDGILDDAEKEGKLNEIKAANKAARSANRPHHTPKTHPNANPLGLGDGLLDDAERYGK